VSVKKFGLRKLKGTDNNILSLFDISHTSIKIKYELSTIYIIVIKDSCNPENFQFTFDRTESKPSAKNYKKKTTLLPACPTLRYLYINVDATKVFP
jgi:hypothetical protein